MIVRAVLLLCCLWPMWASGADVRAVVTIIEGDAALVREARRYALAEGVRLRADDIVETGAKAGLVRLEFNDGSIADLGPSTAVLLAPKFSAERDRRAAELYVRDGWIKFSADQAGKRNRFAASGYDATEIEGVAVGYLGAAEKFAFAETGPVRLVERNGGKAGQGIALKGGESYLQRGTAKAAVNTRPPADMLERMPRAFRDTLPPLAERYKSKEVLPKEQRQVDYADVQGWLAAERPLRAAFVARWRALADDPGFRQGLVANLRAHPEWDRVLFPEKYLPKPPPAAPSAAVNR